ELLLRQFGVQLVTGGRSVSRTPVDLRASAVTVPGDISSAAFLLVAAALIGDPVVTVRRVGVNPTRTGVLDVLQAMSANLRIDPVVAARAGGAAAARPGSGAGLEGGPGAGGA